MDIDERLNNFDRSKMGPANYLSFAIACGFFDEVELVMHPDYDYSDLPNPFFKNNDYRLNLLEMKAYSEHNLSYTIFDSPVNKDPEIPFQIIQGCKFRAQHNYDYVVFCQSPGYTPKTADFMLDVIKEYIIEI